jgi:hypothetical protein
MIHNKIRQDGLNSHPSILTELMESDTVTCKKKIFLQDRLLPVLMIFLYEYERVHGP